MTGRLILLVLLGAALMAPVQTAGVSAQAALTPAQILETMAKTYASCRSYRDSGVVRTSYGAQLDMQLSDIAFTTAFVRPDRFRFEFTEAQPGTALRYIVWCNGEDVRRWWTIKDDDAPGSLSMAIAGATGVSRGAAHIVPRHLLPERISGTSFADLKDARRLDDADLGSTPCLRVTGTLGRSVRTLWIDRETHVLRRLEDSFSSDEHRSVTTTDYTPVLDEDIAGALLDFGAPGETAVPPERPRAPVGDEVVVTVRLRRDAATKAVVRRIDHRIVGTDAEFETQLDAATKRDAAGTLPAPTVLIDATPDVPWLAVVAVMDSCKRLGLSRIRFASASR